MGSFELLLDDLFEVARRRESRQRAPQLSSSLPAVFRTPLRSDTKLMKALDAMVDVHHRLPAPVLTVQRVRQQQAAKVEDIRRRARDLVSSAYNGLQKALDDGSMSSHDIVRGEAYLIAFSTRMGL